METSAKKVYSYSVFYETDPVSGGFVAFVPTLPGCHSQGDTLEEAEANVTEAIELYLESLEEENEDFPTETKSFQGTVTIAR